MRAATFFFVLARRQPLVFIFPFPMCKVGHMGAKGNLLEHLHDLPDPRAPNLP